MHLKQAVVQASVACIAYAGAEVCTTEKKHLRTCLDTRQSMIPAFALRRFPGQEFTLEFFGG
jgi:hypothetical protein